MVAPGGIDRFGKVSPTKVEVRLQPAFRFSHYEIGRVTRLRGAESGVFRAANSKVSIPLPRLSCSAHRAGDDDFAHPVGLLIITTDRPCRG